MRQAWRSGSCVEKGIECLAIGLAWKELVAIDQAEQCHGFFAQGMDDVSIVDDLVVLAGWAGPGRAAGL